MPIRISRLWLPCALAVAAAGCAPQAPIGRPQIGLPPRFESAASPVASAALDRWWEGLGEAQLTDLIETALASATDARLAHARIREARALRAQARAATLPTGNLAASAAAQRTEQLAGNTTLTPGTIAGQGWTEAYQLAFTPSWEIDLFGRLDAIRDRADLDERAAAFDYFAARMALAADVATGLFQARGLAAQEEDAAETLRIARDLAASAQLGLRRGLVSGADAARLDSDVANAEAEVTRLAAAARIAKRSLLVLSGRPFAATDQLVITPLLPPPPPLGETVPSVLLARRPDVLAAGARLASAARAIDIDRLALFPRLDFQPGATLTRTTGLFGGTSVLWSLAAGIGLPVLDRARLIDQLRVTQARGEQAVITYEQAVQSAFREAENTLTQLAADRVRLDELGRATERARYAFDAARTGYRIGLTDLTTLIQSERTWLQTRSTLRQLQSAALGDYVAAVRALGGGWSPQAVARSAGQPDVLLPDLR
jgi:NodT family efflux transporter outer membrane factor (OMF) lipoprotein